MINTTRLRRTLFLFKSWDDLQFWSTGEWQVVEEHLRDLGRARKLYNPPREKMFAALKATPYENTKVMFCGQDPYPDRELATGLAFSVPEGVKNLPTTLTMIFKEYEADLHYPRPAGGSLDKWASEGVLLWNVIPSCRVGLSLSHDWPEWKLLTEEIISKLSEKGVVFVFLGNTAREYAKLVRGLNNSRVIETSHPSPRGNMNSKSPFLGSRIFTRINTSLTDIGFDPVDWRLP